MVRQIASLPGFTGIGALDEDGRTAHTDGSVNNAVVKRLYAADSHGYRPADGSGNIGPAVAAIHAAVQGICIGHIGKIIRPHIAGKAYLRIEECHCPEIGSRAILLLNPVASPIQGFEYPARAVYRPTCITIEEKYPVLLSRIKGSRRQVGPCILCPANF